jgi:integrase
VAGLVKKCALAAGVRGDLSEGDRKLKFSGHSLRAGLASSAAVDERYVQKQLGHASAEMTRRYQRRRDRLRVNLTTAAGLPDAASSRSLPAAAAPQSQSGTRHRP